MGRATSGTGDARSALVDDLRALAGTRSRTSARDRVFPALFALLPADVVDDRERRFAALRDLVDAGIEHIEDDDHRAAAQPLFGFTAGRWRPLGERGQQAAAPFGCGWDAYRRRRTNGPSLLDETTEALAQAINSSHSSGVETADTAAPGADAAQAGADGSSTTDQVAATTGAEITDAPEPAPSATGRTPASTPEGRGMPASDEGPRHPPAPADRAVRAGRGESSVADGAPPTRPGHRSRRRAQFARALVGAGLVVAAAAALGAVRPGADGVDCSLLTHELGAVPEGADAELRSWAPVFRDATDELGPATTRCAALIERAGPLVAQRVSAGDGAPAGLLVAVDGPQRSVVGLHPDEFAELRRRGPTGDRADLLGRPLRRADTADLRVVELDGGVIVTEEHGPSRRVSGDFWARWAAEGGLEGPLGHPVSAFHIARNDGVYAQEFAGGELTKDLDNPVEVVRTLGVSRATPVGDEPRSTVLRTGDGTAWLVHGDDERHLIAGDDAYECAVDEVGPSPQQRFSATAIAALPIGPPYTCPDPTR